MLSCLFVAVVCIKKKLSRSRRQSNFVSSSSYPLTVHRYYIFYPLRRLQKCVFRRSRYTHTTPRRINILYNAAVYFGAENCVRYDTFCAVRELKTRSAKFDGHRVVVAYLLATNNTLKRTLGNEPFHLVVIRSTARHVRITCLTRFERLSVWLLFSRGNLSVSGKLCDYNSNTMSPLTNWLKIVPDIWRVANISIVSLFHS